MSGPRQPIKIIAERPDVGRMEIYAATVELGLELLGRIAPHVPHDATWWVERRGE